MQCRVSVAIGERDVGIESAVEPRRRRPVGVIQYGRPELVHQFRQLDTETRQVDIELDERSVAAEEQGKRPVHGVVRERKGQREVGLEFVDSLLQVGNKSPSGRVLSGIRRNLRLLCGRQYRSVLQDSLLLSQTLGQLADRSGPIKKIDLSGNAIRLQITANADAQGVQRSVTAKLDEFVALSERRRKDAESQAAQAQREREQAEAAAAQMQVRFRGLS